MARRKGAAAAAACWKGGREGRRAGGMR